MRCQDAQILLSTRRDLNRSQQSELDAHLASCRVCAAARVEEDRVTRLLAALPDPGLSTPPRVAAAIGVQAARRTAANRVRRGVALAASFGAVAVVVAFLLTMAAGGALFGSPADTQTAGQPALGTPTTPATNDTLYLITDSPSGEQELLAYDPAGERERFSVPLGRRPAYQISATSDVTTELAALDAALAPDGATLYVLERSTDEVALVAYDVRNGAERWRRTLDDFADTLAPSFVTFSHDHSSLLSVSPDGQLVFLQAVTSPLDPARPSPEQELRVYAADDGQPVSAGVPLPVMSSVLPLSQDEVLAFNPSGTAAYINLERDERQELIEQGVLGPVLLPDGRTVRAVTLDLKVIELTRDGEMLRVASETDLIPNGTFFSDLAAFSPDGRVLAVGQETSDPQTGVLRSEVRIYQAGPWREVARPTFEAPLNALKVSGVGDVVYVVLGQAGATESSPGTGLTPLNPDAATPTSRIVALNTNTGGTVAELPIDRAVVGMLVGR